MAQLDMFKICYMCLLVMSHFLYSTQLVNLIDCFFVIIRRISLEASVPAKRFMCLNNDRIYGVDQASKIYLKGLGYTQCG